MITKQEMFDRAYRGLAKQGWRRCVDEDNACLYNGPNGMHCAWGWVDPNIPKSKEGKDITSLRLMKTGVARMLGQDEFDFAIDLQNVHDASDSAQEMRSALRELAKEHDLKIPKLVHR